MAIAEEPSTAGSHTSAANTLASCGAPDVETGRRMEKLTEGSCTWEDIPDSLSRLPFQSDQ
jgi:hypothetical protein